MRKKMILVMALLVSTGCIDGRFTSPTGPSEAKAATIGGMPSLSFVSLQTSMKVGGEVVMDVVVDNVDNLYGMRTEIVFDHTRLRFIKTEEGDFVKKQNSTSLMSSVPGWDSDRLVVGLTSLGEVSGVNGGGTLFRVTFKALNPGKVELSFAAGSRFLQPRFPGEKDQDFLKRAILFETRSIVIVVE